MTDKKVDGFEEVDALLARAAAEPADVPEYLMARILNDAESLQVAPESDGNPVAHFGFFKQLRDAVGGWAGITGLAAASCVGFWIGINPYVGVLDATGIMIEADEYSSYYEAGEIPGFGWALSGG